MVIEFRVWMLLLAIFRLGTSIRTQVSGDGLPKLSDKQEVIVSTSTVTINEICAKLVNVTGPCRRRRARWEEEPVVMTFNDDDHSIVDQLMMPVLSRIETTAVPAVVQRVAYGRNLPVGPINDLRSSSDSDGPDSRVYFVQLAQFISSLSSRFFPPSTSIVTRTVTIKNTFFVQLCTPSPFPFTTCVARKFNT